MAHDCPHLAASRDTHPQVEELRQRQLEEHVEELRRTDEERTEGARERAQQGAQGGGAHSEAHNHAHNGHERA